MTSPGENCVHPVQGHFGKGAFTLVELLVAATLFIIILGILGGVLSSVSAMSSQASLRMEVTRMGREIFDAIQQDFAQIAQAPAFRGAGTPLRLLVNPTSLDARFNNGCSIFWAAPVARERSAGDLAVVGYFVQTFGTTNAQLRRVFIEPVRTDEHRLYSSPTWIDTALAGAFEGAAPEMTENDRGWFADGVLAIWVRLFDANGEVITTAGDGTVNGYRFNSASGFRTGSGANERRFATTSAMPSAVEIGLLCISPREVSKVNSLPAITATSPLNFSADMEATLAAFQAANPGVKAASLLSRRFGLRGGQP